MLEFSQVTKRFGRKGAPALDGVSFTVEKGEVFGLLGHNGAGKSTAVGIMLGLVYADGGEVKIGGVSVQRARGKALEKTGAIFESPCFYEYLSGWQNLKIVTGYSGYWDEKAARETVGMVGLTDRIHDAVVKYSHGMRQRLALAQALLPRPELLLLDEPTDGLDPDGVIDFRERVRQLNRELGVTILLNSHLLSEVEQVCTRVAILREGALVYEGGLSGLEGEGDIYRLEVDDWEKAVRAGGAQGAWSVERGRLGLPRGADVAELVSALVAAGVKVRGVTLEEESLEELYLRVSRETPRRGK